MSGKIYGAPGFCINTELSRPSRDLLDRLGRFPVAIIGDALGRRSIMDAAIKPINPARRFCGPALTIEVRAGDNLMAHAALAIAKPGDVLVIDAHGDVSTAIMGGLMAHSAAKIGVAAVVIDGALRDRDELFGSNVAFFCRGISPCGPDKDGPGQINLTVSCGGVAVQPGDIIVGDSDGIVVVPQAMAEKAVAASAAKSASEKKRVEEIDRGEIDQSWLMPTLRAKGLLKDGESL
jgi:4-hydroxy-4-methyl-2-oxoglutarate aldolase